jgi:hypothetical protein
MPKASCPQRTKLLLWAFTQYWHLSQDLQKRRKAITKRLQVPETNMPVELAPLARDPVSEVNLPELTSLSSGIEDNANTSTSSASLSSDWSFDADSWSSASDSDSEMEDALPPALDNGGFTATRLHSNDSDSDDDLDSGWDGDDESDGLGGACQY